MALALLLYEEFHCVFATELQYKGLSSMVNKITVIYS